MKKTYKNYTKNLDEAKYLVEKELQFEENRFETLSNRAGFYAGFISILIFLLFQNNFSLYSTYRLWTYSFSVLLLAFSVIIAIFVINTRTYKRPNVSAKNGLLSERYMTENPNLYKMSVIKQMDIVLEYNSNVNNKNGRFLRKAFYLFLIGIILLFITILPVW